MKDLNQLGKELNQQYPESVLKEINSASKDRANHIFSKRLAKGFTQADLAKHAGVSVKTIHRVEAGDDGVTMRTYDKVVGALDIELVVLDTKEDNDFFDQRRNRSTRDQLVAY